MTTSTLFCQIILLLFSAIYFLTGIGQGIIFPATTLALNTYFRKKRNVAMGFSITMTGLGPILMPLLIDVLLENYATTGTLLILAGIAAHSFIGASLLRPFEKQKEVGWRYARKSIILYWDSLHSIFLYISVIKLYITSTI